MAINNTDHDDNSHEACSSCREEPLFPKSDRHAVEVIGHFHTGFEDDSDFHLIEVNADDFSIDALLGLSQHVSIQ